MATEAPVADKAESKHTVKITDIGPCLKKISIEIPAEEVAGQIGTSLDTVLAETELPGFRKGRAPRRLVEKRFGSNIRREAKNQLIASAYSQAVEDSKLKVIGDAAANDFEKLEIIDGQPLKFDLEVEVLPEFKLPSLDGLDVKKPVLEVNDDMVTKEVDRLLLNEGRLEPKENPGPGDYLTGHAVMVDKEGKSHYDIQDAVVQVPSEDKAGKGMILGVAVDDFSKQIGTPKIGSKLTVRTTGPENHENEALRSKALTITFEVKKADQIIPATIDEVAQRYGMSTPVEVREAIKQRIEQRLQVEQQSLMRQQIAKHLMDSTTMQLPERATAAQAGRTLERRRLDMLYRGVDQQKIEENMADLRSSSAEMAVRELKLFFIMNQAADDLGVKVGDAEINSQIAQIAISRGERPEKLRQDLIGRNQVGMVYQQVREHKTMDAILSKAKVTEMPVDEFNAAMKAAGGESAESGRGGTDSKPESPSKSKPQPADAGKGSDGSGGGGGKGKKKQAE